MRTSNPGKGEKERNVVGSRRNVHDVTRTRDPLPIPFREFPTDDMDCGLVDCSTHKEFLEEYANHFIHTIFFVH